MSRARRAVAAALAVATSCAAMPAGAAGAPVFFVDEGLPAAAHRRVALVLASRRAIRDEVPLPPPRAVGQEDPRVEAIALALERAKKAEGMALWDDCVREAAGAMGSATDVLSSTGRFALLRDLHVEVGACLSLANSPSSAKSHFEEAALLDEAPLPVGSHREEAERAAADARAGVVARKRGPLRVTTEPPGAELWVDGRKIAGTTPLVVDVRLGDHFLTLRRFRYEPRFERRSLVPNANVTLALDPARRATLGDQLGAREDRNRLENELARAVWSRAEQLVVATPVGPDGARVDVFDAATGQLVRSAPMPLSADDAAARRAVCRALGETCEPPPRGVPWYVWPLAGALAVGGAIAIGYAVEANRDIKLCPTLGCH